MNKRTTRSSKHSKAKLVSPKQTNLIIYLAIMIILVGICGVLYGKYTNKVDSKPPLAAEDAEQATGQNRIGKPADSDSLNNGNDGNELWADDPIPAGTVNSEEEQEPAEDYNDFIEEPAPLASNTPVRESDKPTGTPKPAQTGNKSTEAPTKTLKLPTTYVVQKGDTLRLIAEKFYQSKEYYTLLAEYNHILFINDMKAGDTLKIPSLSSTTGSIIGSQQGTKDYSKIRLPVTYLIQAGDTLSGVSRMFYKSAEYVDYIAKENKLDKNVGLKAGTNIVIPSLKNDKPEDSETTDHTVKSGETLYSISKIYYGSDKYVMFIADYNHIDNIDDVKAGTVLKIPKA
ncbi:LysM peptidoglycan-binding domain-containing protein [Paenibacillus glycanilyticus]|uniref:LysM peptidoglycan-binding domain-containing protein n=1 Tax=Paenibacillus glycanilyticus TaxID=126569 RepID=UPI0020416238|nr:LysM peptidoglycan-binding domain-containing protein [Paenibacillus glycanilyticus]MCM3628442.1 LysM peptidoglycan-binding domain-containing protein [Paenibacillus glycanilyticus]